MGADWPFGLALLVSVSTFLGLRSCRWSRSILRSIILILTEVLCVKFTSLLNWWGHKSRRKPLIISIIVMEKAPLLESSVAIVVPFSVWTASFVVKTIFLWSVWTSWFAKIIIIELPNKIWVLCLSKILTYVAFILYSLVAL